MEAMSGEINRRPRFEAPRAFHPGVVQVRRAQERLLTRLEALHRQAAALEAERMRVLADYAALTDRGAALLHPDRSAEGRAMERRSMAAEIATALRVSEKSVHADVSDAETLARELPATLDALGEGTISRQHTRKIITQACSLPEGAPRAAFEAAVLPLAESLSPARFHTAAVRLRERLHPESITERTRQAFEERSVWLEPGWDGMASLHLTTSAENVYAIEQRLDSHARALNTAEESRTIGQLRVDAAVDLLLGGPAATLGAVPVALMVTVPALTLAGAGPTGAGAADPRRTGSGSADGGSASDGSASECSASDVGEAPFGEQEPGFLSGYGPICPDIARRLAGLSPTFTRILTRPDTGEIVSVGRESYRVPAAMRRRLRLEDEICRFPGCGRPASACDADHTLDWQYDGETATTNLSHLCRGHHRLKQATSWEVAQDDDRTLTWTSPLGRKSTTHPAARALLDGTRRARQTLARIRDTPPPTGPPPY